MKIIMMNLFYVFLTIQISFAETTKREFTENGTIYIEETSENAHGKAKLVYSKAGQEKHSTKVTHDSAGGVTTTTKTQGPGIHSDISIHQSKEEQAEMTKAMSGFQEALLNCKYSQSSIKHPMVSDFKIKMTVHGLVDGKCKFTQTMPGNGLQTCNFNEGQMREIKATNGKAFQTFMQDEKTCLISGY